MNDLFDDPADAVDEGSLGSTVQARDLLRIAADPILEGVLPRVAQTVGIMASIGGASLWVGEFRRTGNGPATRLLLVTYPMG